MMRLTWATVVAILISAPTVAQQAAQVPSYAKQPPAQHNATGSTESSRRYARGTCSPPAATGRAAPAGQPFAPLSAAAQAQLQECLEGWERQSKSMKTLDCKFTRWHFDMFAAPAGIHATRADGVIKYAAPDKGLFRVDRLVFYAGMKDGKPQFKEQPGQFGEHWVCNGTQLIEFDRSKAGMSNPGSSASDAGTGDLQQPAAIRLQSRRTADSATVLGSPSRKHPSRTSFLIEAWPKRQEDRAQYKLVQIALGFQDLLAASLADVRAELRSEDGTQVGSL